MYNCRFARVYLKYLKDSRKGDNSRYKNSKLRKKNLSWKKLDTVIHFELACDLTTLRAQDFYRMTNSSWALRGMITVDEKEDHALTRK